MSSPPSAHRAYRAACPNCGAPVEFASAASASAVCGYCRSTLVREGEALRRIGVSAELFDDHSPLQLGASGTYQGVAFTLVGRLQYGYAAGTWNEWHALFDGAPGGQRSGWLSEDNGAYVLVFEAAWPGDAPADAAAALRLPVGQPLVVDGRAWTLASVVRAHLIAAQGELPAAPRLQGEFVVAELRNVQDEVGSLDYSDAAHPAWSIGRPVRLAELRMSGMAQATSEKTLAGRSLECPGCGAALPIRLSTTQAIACPQCHTVTDVSQGVGGELEHYAQNNAGEGGLMPLIPLGRSGTLALGTEEAEPWQVVGYLERCDLPDPDDDEEQVFWREYLLYHRELGFAFLVDSEEDGWSWVRPITGTPTGRGKRVSWRGIGYELRASYRAKVSWVLGEFYWRVRRGEEARVLDYVGSGKGSAGRLSCEQSAGELVWSAGRTIASDVVAKAFGITDAAALRRDVKPLSATPSGGWRQTLFFVLIVVLLLALETCSDDDSGSGSRSGGGSFGGFSSGGGGHK